MITTLEAIADIYQDEATKAAHSLDVHRAEVHEMADRINRALGDQITIDAQKAALVNIIETALDQVDEATINAAPIIMGQFVAAQIKHPGALAGDGRLVLEVFIDAAKTLDNATRRQALEALLLVATGAISGGLYHWLTSWHAPLTVDSLNQFAAIIDRDAHSVYTSELAKLKADQSTASRIAEKFAAPMSITPTMIEPKQKDLELIAVRNHNEGTPMRIAGVSFPGHGSITRITPQEFKQVQESDLWKSGVSVNALEVVQ